MIIRVSTPADHIKVPCLPLRPPRSLPSWRNWAPFHQCDTGRLRTHLQRLPDPRSRRGRWYPLAGLLLICACAVVSGARTITEITEWGQRATTTVLEQLGIRRHLPGHRRTPSHATLTRLLAALDGDALDTVIGAYLAEHDHTDVGGTGSVPRPAIAVDGKALSGSAHRQQRHRPLLSAVTHAPTVTLAQREVGAKTNETAAFRPLLEPSIWPVPWSPSTPCTVSRTRCAGWWRRRKPTASP
ncbi:transposase family protein [Streptomyces sp. NBC_01017]|uniref:transposase family protein n=1 Tax=Streptomyces sp. NBC_01017 TaxID=2903721 RepID=UPI003868550D